MKRVVVTGMAGITALGSDWATVEANLRANVSGIERMPDWDRFEEVNTRLGGPVKDFTLPAHYTRRKTRTMGRVSLLSVRASELALEQAGLLDDPEISSGAMGVSYGSCTGSTDAICEFGSLLMTGKHGKFNATTYLRMMSHTTAVNVGLFFGLKGRVIPTCSACTSGSQGIGYAYEAIKYGMQPMMLAGGAEELCPSEAAVFDALFAASVKNDAPKTTPAPFDRDRDGLVIGEGAGSLVLEEYEHAKARGARIYAEIVGYGCNSDGDHATHPNQETMGGAMDRAFADAGLSPDAIGFVSCHGTATEQGDIAESNMTRRYFNRAIPAASWKGHLGHTLGACGAIESWWAIEMMNRGWFAPTLNLHNLDPRCGELDFVTDTIRPLETEYVVNNNFAFGGINTALIFRRMP
ncbi:beta-ketoacyl-ACP synthase [Sinimarinibacterium sp. CAU 1509]|uniref:beta-ketoacyl-ACP synthase n=1 Tax=Sinimarinibacterium sp. CAU 1509 TaxID=2562283 RepID=UPI0010AC026C|nr:beta-ketoacyl-ACP synthase [Sinimarinibacterium sp. CAU 1509]TJY58285.1 beta-ketoacyl-ACP synthase [Sinimarinibacterium sp. CAU 1509]